eukprot:SAG22_NODE_93_length_20834_cov_27.179503_12_plen_294_part_00
MVQYFESTSTITLADKAATKVTVAVATGYPFDETVTFTIDSSAAFDFHMRIPAWCEGATAATNTAAAATGHRDGVELLPAGAMALLALPAGKSTVTLTLPLKIRVSRRPAYALDANTSLDTNAANIYRGPVLYALARDFVLDHSKPYDDAAGLLPVGQAHGQDNYLLGTGNWSFAVRLSDDTKPEADLVWVPTPNVPSPPKGQGIFSAYLAPGHIRAKAQVLTDWPYIGKEYGGRGSPTKCEKGTSIPGYSKVWAGMPPKSPVSGVAGPLHDAILLPMGATDLRVAEFPTTKV